MAALNGGPVDGARNATVRCILDVGGLRVLHGLHHYASGQDADRIAHMLDTYFGEEDGSNAALLWSEGDEVALTEGVGPPASRTVDQDAHKPAPDMWTPDAVEEQRKQEMMEAEAQLSAAEEATRKKANEILAQYCPTEFFDPISKELLRDPVTTADGHTYERREIERWFNTRRMENAHTKFTSPITGAVLAHTRLTPNHALRSMIEQFKPGWTRRADTSPEWSCVACTLLNSPTAVFCKACGAERPFS